MEKCNAKTIEALKPVKFSIFESESQFWHQNNQDRIQKSAMVLKIFDDLGILTPIGQLSVFGKWTRTAWWRGSYDTAGSRI